MSLSKASEIASETSSELPAAEIINEKELNEVSGGTAAGPSWTQNGMTFYRIVFGDTLSEIAARFHTSCYAIQALNPTLIKDINVIKAGWEIRVL